MVRNDDIADIRIPLTFFSFSGERRFICTQGPLPTTVDDFWTMIVQEEIDAIVMLCDIEEKGRVKCHQYWPAEQNNVSLLWDLMTINCSHLLLSHSTGNELLKRCDDCDQPRNPMRARRP